jgi:undecaprenyl phosphate-alpha-L-ara4N flippase subunit ArnE
MSYFYLFLTVILISIGQILQKLAARRLDTQSGVGPGVLSLLGNSRFWQAVFAMGLGLLAWLLALSDLDISRAYPILGSSFALTALLSVALLDERLNVHRCIGIALITLGVATMVSG